MLNWINTRFGTSFTEGDLSNIKDFALLWNVFEKIVCNTRCSLPTIEQQIQGLDFDLRDFEEHLDYFKNRYVEGEQMNERFGHLRIGNNKYIQLVSNILLEQDDSVTNSIMALLTIVYRYRNNLFHGNKNVQYLDTQEVNFYHANQVLIKVLNYF